MTPAAQKIANRRRAASNGKPTPKQTPARTGTAPIPSPPAAVVSADELLIQSIAEFKARPVCYLVPGRLAYGKAHTWGGRGGAGKSTAARQLAADATRGRCAFGMTYDPPGPIDVLLVSCEVGIEDAVLPDLLAKGADVGRVHLVRGITIAGKKYGFQLSPKTIEIVGQKLLANPAIKLVVIDPVASYVGGKVDNNSATELRAAILDPLNALAESTGIVLIYIVHLNKGSGEAVDRFAGSAAWRDAVRAAYIFTVDRDDPTRRLLMPVKWNLPAFETTTIPFRQVELSDADAERVLLAPQFSELDADGRSTMRRQLRRLEFDPPETIDANEAMNSKSAGKDPSKIAKCAEWLKAFLGGYAHPSKEILDAATKEGFTFDNVTKGKAKLKEESGLRNSNLGQFRGEWWSGFGDPREWKLRPYPSLSVHDSHDSHDIKTRESRETNETIESRETQGERDLREWKERAQQRQRDKDGIAANKPKAPRKRKDGHR